MNEHQRNEALDKAFNRYSIQLKQLEDEAEKNTINQKDYYIRFREIRDHYNNAIEAIESIYRKTEAA